VNAELKLTQNTSKYLKITRMKGSRTTGHPPEKAKPGKQKSGNPVFVLPLSGQYT
jgi:hypothetical protein